MAWAMKVDLRVGVSGLLGVATDGRSEVLRLRSSGLLGVWTPGRVVALLAADACVCVVVLESVVRPVREVSETEPLSDCLALSFPFLVSGWMLSSLRVSMGKSATPIIICVAVPTRADAAPERGSQGPSSVSYSRGRNLLYLVQDRDTEKA